ncbi:serine O-acetyltransferase EpsC [Treponema sp. J25]|jgi:serine O-acetyltransferase|uniref:serine O-acetyltransferase EpsC n=1 Tax=Treponema sp. J25 TaxID=2094121 RepID=UPI001053E3BC|nr:serine O-acetyltransferase EpsC [Treponema sp. J25]TCW62139.1 serine acetyltransferase [Treponema sp. J25]
MIERLASPIASIVSSYDTYGLINHTSGNNLPSRESIQQILRDIQGLLFPGFGESELIDPENLHLKTAERVYRLAQALVAEIEKSLSFTCRTGTFSCDGSACREMAETITVEFFSALPEIRRLLSLDVEAAFQGDPAAKSIEEVIVAYPGLRAIATHRVAHFFWNRQVPLIPRIMSEIIHGETGIDIHPGATIGESFFIDHGTGVVIGETTVIGRNVKIYQGVTLGALSVDKSQGNTKRHPTIEDDVTIYAGATILGGETTIGEGCIIGGNVWLTESVPPHRVVYVKTGEHIIKPRKK